MGDTSTTRTKIRKGAGASIRQASPDDPIYTRGFVIGGRRSKAASTSTKSSSSSKSKQQVQDAAADKEK